MQKIYFKKIVDLNHQLKELVSISVDESISYKMESQGMRAVGSIVINGDYKDINTKHSFHETIDLDILAQFDKITDKRDFHVKVEDFDYTISDGDLSLIIQACIYGVLDDEDRVIETMHSSNEPTEDDVALEIENLLREESIDQPVVEVLDEPVIQVEETQKVKPEVKVETKKEKPEEKETEHEDDDEDIGTYYFYIVQDGDSYQSIAAHYQVDEYQLKAYNHDRPLTKGTIVIVPYYS